MQYKGYVGSVEFSEADGLFFGKVLGIRALISYEGTNAAELVADFHGAVDDYLSLCEAENSEPEKAYKGSFNIRVSPELHKQAAICAMAQQVSLNTLVEDALREYVAERKEGRGCGQKVGLQREATECTQKSRKKWRSENMSDWDR